MAQLKNIKMDAIDLPDGVNRTAYDPTGLQELAGSLEEVGLLQPISLRMVGNRYQIIAGSRRYLAGRLLKWETIPSMVHQADDERTQLMRVIENLQREQLPPLDEAQAVRILVDQYGLGIEETSRKLHKSANWVRSRLDLLHLPELVLAAVQRAEISQGVAFELGKIDDPNQMSVLLGYAVQAGCTREQAAKWREQFQAPASPISITPQTSYVPPPTSTPNVPQVDCFVCESAVPVSQAQAVDICIGCMDIVHNALAEYISNHPEIFQAPEELAQE